MKFLSKMGITVGITSVLIFGAALIASADGEHVAKAVGDKKVEVIK